MGSGGASRGGIRGGETVAGEAGGLPLGTRTASRSAAPSNTLFLCGRSTNNHSFLGYIAEPCLLDKTYLKVLSASLSSEFDICEWLEPTLIYIVDRPTPGIGCAIVFKGVVEGRLAVLIRKYE
jgi:hypothetical protein